jgi:predicted metal-dependent phosphoesterase TrpH
MLVDLQVHTTATPGHATWEPGPLMSYAKAHGIDVLAVTDHNTTAQVGAALEAAQRYGVRLIPAVELDSAFGGKLWHVLLYGVAPNAPAILALCNAVVERNARDAQEIIEYFRKRGHRLPSLERLNHQPTVAEVGCALVKDGIVAQQTGVEDEAAGTGWIMTHLRDLYRPVPVDEAVAVVHREGGLAILAHPGRSKGVYAIPATAEDISAMVEIGIDGIEALYAKHTPEQQRFYDQIAAQNGLLVTAGSDSHHPADGLYGRPAADCAEFLAHFGVDVV